MEPNEPKIALMKPKDKLKKANLFIVVETRETSLPHSGQVHITSSETHPTSGPDPVVVVASTRSRGFSLLSFSNIFTLRSLPDSTLSIAGSSSQAKSKTPALFMARFVGVEGKLQNPGRRIGPLGDPNTEPLMFKPYDVGIDFTFPSCKLRREVSISLTEFDPNDRLNVEVCGDNGGDSDGGVAGGDSDPGDDMKTALA